MPHWHQWLWDDRSGKLYRYDIGLPLVFYDKRTMSLRLLATDQNRELRRDSFAPLSSLVVLVERRSRNHESARNPVRTHLYWVSRLE